MSPTVEHTQTVYLKLKIVSAPELYHLNFELLIYIYIKTSMAYALLTNPTQNMVRILQNQERCA